MLAKHTRILFLLIDVTCVSPRRTIFRLDAHILSHEHNRHKTHKHRFSCYLSIHAYIHIRKLVNRDRPETATHAQTALSRPLKQGVSPNSPVLALRFLPWMINNGHAWFQIPIFGLSWTSFAILTASKVWNSFDLGNTIRFRHPCAQSVPKMVRYWSEDLDRNLAKKMGFLVFIESSTFQLRSD